MKDLLAISALSLVAVSALAATNLPLVGPLPALASGWTLREEGRYGDTSFQWHWVVFTNTQSDVLSLASHRLSPGEERDLIYMSDTAHESFFDGTPMWTRKPDTVGGEIVESIRNAVVKLDAPSSTTRREALEFSFVFEKRHGANRLAHGYAVRFEDVVVLVQHTSVRPIASGFVRGVAVSLQPTGKAKS